MPGRSLVLGLVVPLLLLVGVPAASARFVAGDSASTTDLHDLDEVLRPPSASAVTSPSRGVWPLLPRPEVVHPFDPPAVRWGSGHRGVDLAGHVGQPVRAALAGSVSFVGRIAGVGVVVVSHGATRTTYQPLLATVSRGERVRAGTVVGRLAGTGSHCVPRACLHWGLRRGAVYLDPLTLVDAPRPVRLLPW